MCILQNAADDCCILLRAIFTRSSPPYLLGRVFSCLRLPYEAKQKETQEDVPGIDSRCL